MHNKSLSTVCYYVSPSPVDSQVLSNRHEQVLRSMVPLTLLCPVSGGPFQLVIPNLHTSSKDLTYSRHRRGDITSSTCCACDYIKHHILFWLNRNLLKTSAPALPSFPASWNWAGYEYNINLRRRHLSGAAGAWPRATTNLKQSQLNYPHFLSGFLYGSGEEAGKRRRHLTPAVEREDGGGLWRQGRTTYKHGPSKPISSVNFQPFGGRWNMHTQTPL